MIRWLVVAAAVAVVATASAQQPPAFRARRDLVRVFTTVTDRDGRLVTGLGRDDFQVKDNGKPQPLTDFDNSPQPIRLIVMLDVSGSMEGNLSLLRDASAQLFARLRDDDKAKVGSFGHEIEIAPRFSNDPGDLAGALPHAIAPDAPTPLWRAVDEAMSAFDPNEDIRKVVLVLSDGKDTGPLSFRDRPSSEADVIDRARQEDVMIYGVGMRSRQRVPPQFGMGRGSLQQMLLADLPDPGLAKVAEETGGGYIEIKLGEDLGAAFERVADELHTQYLLGFAPPAHDGKVHKLDVRVDKPGMKPRARRSYVAPKG
ncbi:MAG TPA: VWA domain-containing protein [Vicinamibacterales bacterium]|nr:VWA domain-containing protein [Vicinamibacterales bacterium]